MLRQKAGGPTMRRTRLIALGAIVLVSGIATAQDEVGPFIYLDTGPYRAAIQNLETGAEYPVIDWSGDGPPPECPPEAFYRESAEAHVLKRCGTGQVFTLIERSSLPVGVKELKAHDGPGQGTDDPGPSKLDDDPSKESP